MESLRRKKDRPSVQMAPGAARSILHSGEALMLVRIEMSAGAGVPAHAHPHEQITHLVSGRVSFELDGKKMELSPGDSVLMRADVPHGATAIEDSVLIDAFSPPRSDFLESE